MKLIIITEIQLSLVAKITNHLPLTFTLPSVKMLGVKVAIVESKPMGSTGLKVVFSLHVLSTLQPLVHRSISLLTKNYLIVSY